MNILKLSTIVLITLLSACSLMSPVETNKTSKYVLDTLPNPIHAKFHRNKILLIGIPDSQPLFNTTRIIYSLKPYEIAYFGNNEWAETPAQMLQNLLVKTFQRGHYFKAVVAAPQIGYYDYFLATQIVKFQQNFYSTPAVVELTLRVQLLRGQTTLATQEITMYEPILGKTPYDGIIATNRLSAKVIAAIQHWCLQKI